jgi:hypothetical protein
VACGGTQEIDVQRTYSRMRAEGDVNVRASNEGRSVCDAHQHCDLVLKKLQDHLVQSQGTASRRLYETVLITACVAICATKQRSTSETGACVLA